MLAEQGLWFTRETGQRHGDARNATQAEAATNIWFIRTPELSKQPYQSIIL